MGMDEVQYDNFHVLKPRVSRGEEVPADVIFQALPAYISRVSPKPFVKTIARLPHILHAA